MSDPMGIVNLNTGQILEEGFLAHQKPRKKMPFRTWFFTNQKAVERIQDLTAMSDVKVLMEMMKRMPSGNTVAVSQKEIATATGLSPAQVSTSVRRLIAAELIRREGTAYVVHEELAWKGDLNQYPYKTVKPVNKRRAA